MVLYMSKLLNQSFARLCHRMLWWC